MTVFCLLFANAAALTFHSHVQACDCCSPRSTSAVDEIEIKLKSNLGFQLLLDEIEVKFRISTSGGWNWKRDEIEKKLKSNLGEQAI